MLTGHAEQVTLVVMQHLAIRACPQQAIAMTAVGGLDDHATGDHRIKPQSLSPQPFAGRPVFRFGEGFRLHGKTGGEHLRQNDQVGAASLLQQRLEMLEVGLAVVPGQGSLDQRNGQLRQCTQITHSFSAASRRVSSRLAKHSRTRRWPTGGVW
ncbi:hypothetical protein D3C81_1667690 [compost metagenome]